MGENRIKLTDTTMDVMVKMSEGNPGALNALMQILSRSKEIDPDDVLGGLGTILHLDTLEIYGTDIYILYNDICDRNLAFMLAVLRAVQLGLFKDSVLKDACHRQDRSGKALVPVEDLYSKVKERLPNFDCSKDQNKDK
jgi:hypothetical protein